jgi:hypothetical protein
MSEPSDYAEDARESKYWSDFTAWLAEKSCSDLRDIVESQDADSSVQKGLLLLLISLSDYELATFIIEHCRTDSLRAEFEALPRKAWGIPPRNA